MVSLGEEPVSTLFVIDGPYTVPFYKGRGGRTITDDGVREFWSSNPEIGKRRGCYVFGIRAGMGFTPGYVGQATKSFKSEVFQHHKLTRYQQFLADRAKGTPVLFFVVAPKQPGATNATHITQLEDFLLQAGVAANPHLMNIKGTKQEQWGIAGVIRGGGGNPSEAAKDFRSMMKI